MSSRSIARPFPTPARPRAWPTSRRRARSRVCSTRHGRLPHGGVRRRRRRRCANPRHDFDNTFRGVFEVLEAARQAGSRVVFPSTASIFDASNALPLSERAFPRPTSPYAAGKLGRRGLLPRLSSLLRRRRPHRAAVQRLRRRHVPLRDSRHRPQDSAEHEELSILGDGTQVRDYLFIDDAVRGLDDGGDCRAQPGEEYNVASGEPVQLLDLARTDRRDDGLSRHPHPADGTVVCRRHRALVRRHLESARARVRAARRSAKRPRAHDCVAGDAAGHGRGHVVTASRRPKSSTCCRTSSAACSATSATCCRIARPDGFSYAAVQHAERRRERHGDLRSAAADREVRFDYRLPNENVHAVLRRLARAIP